MIDINKQYRTRDGREVRIYATDRGGCWPVHGAIKTKDSGVWVNYCWSANGSALYSELDLIEVRPRHTQTLWTNVYRDKRDVVVFGQLFFTRETADIYNVHHNRIACIKVELDFEEGEGL